LKGNVAGGPPTPSALVTHRHLIRTLTVHVPDLPAHSTYLLYSRCNVWAGFSNGCSVCLPACPASSAFVELPVCLPNAHLMHSDVHSINQPVGLQAPLCGAERRRDSCVPTSTSRVCRSRVACCLHNPLQSQRLLTHARIHHVFTTRITTPVPCVSISV
jgi:hypothetical protein